MNFEYYVLNFNCNKHKVETFNIFNNINVNKWTEQAVKKYLRSPRKYSKRVFSRGGCNKYEDIYGFDAFCAEIRSILMNQLWARREYEISVSDAFVCEISDVVNKLDQFETLDELKEYMIKINKRNESLEKWDCFAQCEKNIPVIAREVIYQYKQQIKEQKNEKM